LGTTDNSKTHVFDLPSRVFQNPFQRARRPFPGDHSPVEAVGGKMYAFSGLCCQQFCQGCNAQQKTQVYDPSTDVWTLGSPIPWPVWRRGGVSCRGMRLGNPARDVRRARGACPCALQVEGSQSSAMIDGKIYLCGGLLGDAAIRDCGVYDPANDA
jgi:hypothetical protein